MIIVDGDSRDGTVELLYANHGRIDYWDSEPDSGADNAWNKGLAKAKGDWGWSPEYVDAMWRMLPTDNPEDFVIATGESNSLEDFVMAAFAEVGLDWSQHVVQDSRLFRAAGIRYNCGNADKARRVLKWQAQLKMRDVVREMVNHEQQS